jgi:hypothetical protein
MVLRFIDRYNFEKTMIGKAGNLRIIKQQKDTNKNGRDWKKKDCAYKPKSDVNQIII